MGTLTPGTPSSAVSHSRVALPFVAVLALLLALLPRVDARGEGEGEVVEETATEAVVEEEVVETTTTTAAPAETTTTTQAPAETTTTTAAPAETTTTMAPEPAPVPVLWTTTADGTPRYDFAPGETVYIHGADFPAEALLDIVVTRPDGSIVTGDGSFSCTNCWDSVMTGAGGGFVYAYVLNGIEGLYTMAAYASPWTGEAALATGTFHDSAPAQIRSDTHEGEKKDLSTQSSAGWTTGNTTEFQEGDWVNFRFHLTADDASVGQMAVHFSLEGSGCDFFEPEFHFFQHPYGGAHPGTGLTFTAVDGGGATLTVTRNGASAAGGEWIQNLDLVTDGAGEWTVYYHLHLTDNVHGCTGSSQHSRLAAGPNPGAYTQTGQKNVPVPANAIVRFPDITVIKQIDRDGDGTFESLAGTGEYQFDLSPDPTSITSGEPLTTNGSGSVFFENIVPDGDYSILESQLIVGGDGVHEFVGLAPSGNENCALVGGVVTATVAAGDAGGVQHATCIVQNRARTGTLEVVKDLVPGTDSGTFDLSIDGTAHATGVGDGGTTGVQTVYQGTHSIAEAGAGGTLLSDYASSVACVDAAGAPVATTGSGPWDVEVLDGQAITCTITNTRTSSITIVKDATGVHAAGAEFDYTTTGLTPSGFTLGDGDSQAFTGLLPGTYTVVEADETGWYRAGLVCTGASNITTLSATSGTVTIDLAAGENVTCTYENVEYGSITVVKQAIGVNDATAVFDYTTSGLSPASFTLGDGGSKVFAGLPPGGYGITEAPEAGWELIGLTCSAGTVNVATGTASVTLAAGQDVTCTYTNRELGSLTIVKQATGVDAATTDFDFTASTNLSPTAFTLGDGETRVFANLSPDAYTITEAAEAGWVLTNLTCTGTTAPVLLGGVATVNLAAGEHATCTYTNTQLGSITIVKEATGTGSATATFAYTTGTLGSFSLGDGDAKLFDSLGPGAYSITEALVVGDAWSLTGISCTGLATPAVTSLATATATLQLAAGEDAICTFSNLERGKITIMKETVPDGDPATFLFDASYQTPQISLGDGGSDESAWLVPDVYTIAENVPAGWALTGLTCEGTATAAAIDVAAGTAGIKLAAGEHALCTFTNTKLGSIKIEKDAIGLDAATTVFEYSSSTLGGFGLGNGGWMTFTDLLPGTYSVTELSESGWSLTGLSCTAGTADLPSATATVELAAGQHVTCAFENTQLGSVTFVKDAIGVDAATAEFDYTTTGLAPASFALGDGASQVFDGLLPGSYSATEAAEPGWALTGLSCTGAASYDASTATGQATVDLAAGEDAVCTYTNTQLGSIKVVKDATGTGSAAAIFDFATTNLSPSSFTLNDGGYAMFTGLLPGAYGVDELAEPGWTLTGISCSGTAAPAVTDAVAGEASLTLAAGEDAVCTFSNREQGTITIEKQTLPDGDAAMFQFDTSYQTASIMLGDGQSDTSVMLEPGTYTVGETVTAGWDLITIVCEGTASAAVIDMDSASASITLAAGESALCTFTNQKRGSITIVKEDVSAFDNPGDGDDFAFSGDLGAFTLDDPDADDGDAFGDTFVASDLVTGSYTVTETLAPDDDPLDLDGPWSLESIVCSGADVTVDGTSVTVALDPGEDATCTFNNEQEEIELPPFLLGDFVWDDVNDNGLQNPGENGIAGVTVELLDAASSTVLASTVTSAGGLYSFWITEPGTYVVRFTTPASYDITDGLVGSNPAIDSNLLPTGLTPEIEVTVAKMLGVGSDLTIDAGFVFIEPPDIIETGADTEQMAGLAGALLLGGFLLLVASRRRRVES